MLVSSSSLEPAMPLRPPLSRRDKQLAKPKARRVELSKRRGDTLNDIVSGSSYACLAEKHKISATARAPLGSPCLAVAAGQQRPANPLKIKARGLSLCVSPTTSSLRAKGPIAL